MNFGKLDQMGNIKCPHCGCCIITPMGHNPYKGGIMEKMLLIAWNVGRCPLCKESYTVNEITAMAHNHFWFPDDPEFQVGQN